MKVCKSKARLYSEAMSTLIFQHQHRVSYAECTVGNHVYYGRYLDLLETARGEFFRSLGAPFLRWQQEDTVFPVVECRLRYKAPARYDDEVVVRTHLKNVRESLVHFGYELLRAADGLVLAEGETTHIVTDAEMKVKLIPEKYLVAFRSAMGKV